jgi:cytochrome c biogenesis factor
MHELDSFMLFIHPTLAIIGYVFIFSTFIYLLKLRVWKKKTGKKLNDFVDKLKKNKKLFYLGLSAWTFTLAGLVSGMIWAQTAWGAYWSWDPKESATLLLFLSQTAYFYYYHQFELPKYLVMLKGLSCILVFVTILISFILPGLHSFI